MNYFFLISSIAISVPIRCLAIESCFNFISKDLPEQNICKYTPRVMVNTEAGNLSLSCPTCTITYSTLIDTDTVCSPRAKCAKLIFDDNILYQDFFRRFRTQLPHWIPKSIQEGISFGLVIVINKYNITEINDEYLASTMSMDVPNLSVTLRFENSSANLPPLVLGINNFNLTINSVTIRVRCDDYQLAGYKINKTSKDTLKGRRLILKDQCEQLPSTRQVLFLKHLFDRKI